MLRREGVILRGVISRISDELLKEVSINNVLFARALLHLEHQLGAGEGDAHTFDFFGFDFFGFV